KRPAAIAAASHGPGRLSAPSPPGTSPSHRSTPGARNSAEYLESTPNPAAAPAASHQPVRPLAGPFVQACARQTRVIVQNRLAGTSGVASMPPRQTVSVALYQSAARKAVGSSAP